MIHNLKIWLEFIKMQSQKHAIDDSRSSMRAPYEGAHVRLERGHTV